MLDDNGVSVIKQHTAGFMVHRPTMHVGLATVLGLSARAAIQAFLS